MSNGIGRITGPLLKENLLRNGIDLSFETDLLYLNVNDKKLGVKNDGPGRELEITGTSKTKHLIVDELLDTPKIEINTAVPDTISIKILGGVTSLFLNSLDRIVAPAIATDVLIVDNNTLSVKTANTNLNLEPARKVVSNSNVQVNSNIHSTGDITFGGNITFGNNDEDNVTFFADVNTDLIPDQDYFYSLGTASKTWNEFFSRSVVVDNVYSDTLTSYADIDYTKLTTNTIFVAINGSNTNKGSTAFGPFRTLKHALSQAVSGDTIFIFPGNYEEIFPLQVPAGVSVVGHNIRTVVIFPTVETKNKDCFLLNGETLVSDLTIKGFNYDTINDTGYGFRFDSGTTVTSRSPYVQNVSVITNSTTGGTTPADIYVDSLGLAGSYSSNSVAVDQINYTQSQVESWIGKTLVTWNGEGFPVTFYEIVDVIDEPLDPGFVWRIVLERDLEDPGEGIYQFSIYPNNGETSIVGTSGYTAATDYSRSFLKTSLPPLFDTTVTEFWTCQIGEGLNIVDSVEEDPVNSAWWRVNFKDLATLTFGLPIFTSPSQGSTVIPSGRGALVDGKSVTANSKEASMLFHSCTFIVPGSTGLLMKNGVRIEWLNCFTYFADIGLHAVNGVEGFANQATRFGAEIRSIGSANVYGVQGSVADGSSTLMYLINHNFAYIGTGLDSSNDKTLTIQENETVELNNGKIYYSSQSHNGDFRVGDQFFVDFENGNVSFDSTQISLIGIGSVFFEGDLDRTIILADSIEVGDFLFSGNTLKTLTKDFNISSSSEQINFLSDTTIEKNLVISNNFDIDGTINFGNQTQDTITFNTNFTQDLVPKTNITYDIGSLEKIWRDIYIFSLKTQNSSLSTNEIASLLDNDLVISGNNSSVILESLIFLNNEIINTTEISLTPDVDHIVRIDAKSLKLPQQQASFLSEPGELLISSVGTPPVFEGRNLANNSILGGVFSPNKTTKISLVDNTIQFITGKTATIPAQDILTTIIDSEKLTTSRLAVDDIVIDQNIIATVNNQDLNLNSDGVLLNSITISQNTIEPATENTNLTLSNTGTGYGRIFGTGAAQLPFGSELQRPSNPLVGNTRFNTDLGYVEVWTGADWRPVTGTGEVASFEYADEQTTLWSIILG